jgi:hypothetical protein
MAYVSLKRVVVNSSGNLSEITIWYGPKQTYKTREKLLPRQSNGKLTKRIKAAR